MHKKYVSYEIYKCPRVPTEWGEYYGKTPILEQALNVCSSAKQSGLLLFIKGVTASGERVYIIH